MAPRPALLVTLTIALLAAPLATSAQQAGKVPRIGILWGIRASVAAPLMEALRQGLREQGYAEDQSITIESRSAEERYERLPGLAAELVRLPVDVIVAPTTVAAVATRKATATIPIVTVVVYDHMESGLASSLARPGGNVTGLTQYAGTEVVGKQLDLLREAAPRTSRVGVLWNPENSGHARLLREAESAAGSLGLRPRAVGVRRPDELDGAFATMARERVDALVILPDTIFLTQRARLAELAVKHRMPAMAGLREYVDAGGLMAYGASLPDLFRRAGLVVAKILTGAKPADLPIERPTKFELVVNLKTAKALGLTMPQSILVRADEIVR
jgi:putative tryptophan/tyrosine transport system substrate-binding protein